MSIEEIAVKKAQQSICKYKVSAIGFDRYGNIIGTAMNKPRFNHVGGSKHAEMNLMRKYGQKLKTIIICRSNNSGDVIHIDPCGACKRKADDLGIKIKSIVE